MKTLRTPLAALAILGLTLTACGQSEEDKAIQELEQAAQELQQELETMKPLTPEAPEAVGIKKDEPAWFITTDNAIGKFVIPGEPSPEYEQLREQVEADPVTYITVTVDNRNGTSGVNMYDLSAYDADGKKYEFQKIGDTLEEWRDTIDMGDYDNDTVTLSNQYITASNEATSYVDPGQVADIIMTTTTTDLPEAFTGITIQAHGAGDPVEAHPQTDSQGIDLDFEAPQQ